MNTLNDWHIHTHSRSFKKKMLFKGSFGSFELKARDYLIVNSPQQKRPAELSPLPGFHSLSLEQAREQLCQILQSYNSKELQRLEKPTFLKLIENYDPSVQSALSQLWCSLNSHFIGASDSLNIVSNQLIFDLNATTFSLKSTPAVVKVKIGRIDRNREIKNLKALLQKYPDYHFRLDGNRAFTPQTLAVYLEELAAHRSQIQYIEEPFESLHEHLKDFSWPLALDESLEQWQKKRPTLPSHIQALVIKPSLLGGILALEKLIASPPVGSLIISSAFDGEIGQFWNKKLANEVNKKGLGQVHGLDTDMFFKDQV